MTINVAGFHAAPPQDLKGKNVVLVHGAFADGSSWDKVIPLLEARGLHVGAVRNPLRSLADDVSATKRVIDQQTGPVILVGHSWGGVVVSEAGNDDKVKSLVVISAQDRMIDPTLQQKMAANIDAKVTRVNASHVAMVRQPKAVADAILAASRAAQ
ncbi:alpha/beta fold hydrolase [Paraburkholderia sediminicola]|uniref:Alpha/beta fold hydrolase n=1 Tax=Paraburkholderia rhynchosiae TaxID=487049 RepID=A0ACC7N6J8_9BURK